MPHVKTAPFDEAFTGDSLNAFDDRAREAMRRAEAVVMQMRVAGQRSAVARSRVLVLCDPGDLESAGLAEATRPIFDEAGIDIDLASLSDCLDLHSADALLVTTAPENAGVLVAAIDGMSKDNRPRRSTCAYALVMTGEAGMLSRTRCQLTDALDNLGLIDAMAQARLDRFAGIQRDRVIRPFNWYANEPMREAAMNAARDLVDVVTEIRADRLMPTDQLLAHSRLEAGIPR